MSPKSRPTRAAWVSLALLTTSCAAFGTEPRVPAVLDPDGDELNYTVEAWNQEKMRYLTAMKASPPNLATAKASRDRMVNRVRADIRSAHADYETELTEKIANWNIQGDLVQLALALAGTVTKGNEAKTVITAVIAATAGAKLSVDKNRFREKTSEILVQHMRAARLRKDTEIQRKLQLTALEYPLEEAVCDLVDLFQAGTLAEAFQQMAQQAGVTQKGANDDAKSLTQQRVTTTVQAQPPTLEELFERVLRLPNARLAALEGQLQLAAEPDMTRERRLARILQALQAETAATGDTATVRSQWESRLR